jgi:hypothetical protein
MLADHDPKPSADRSDRLRRATRAHRRRGRHLTAAGIPQEQAVAATFTHRLFTAYLPPVWGWFALQWLRRKDYV